MRAGAQYFMPIVAHHSGVTIYNRAMPFSYDIDPLVSSRRQRRSATPQEAGVKAVEGTEVKGLGATIANQSFDPKAYDGDGDGRVQDGSTFERPATPFVRQAVSTGLRSLAADHSSFSFQGLTNDQIVTHAIPENPTDFAKALLDSRVRPGGPTSYTRNFIASMTEGFGTSEIFDFSPESVKALRVTLRDALDSNPAFADAVREWGLPPMAVVKKGVVPRDFQGGYEWNFNFMMVNPNMLGRRSLYSHLVEATNEKFLGEFGMLNTSRKVVYTGPTGTVIHEFGHYINSMALHRGSAGDPAHDLASVFALESWEGMSQLRPWVRDRDALRLIDNEDRIIDAIENGKPTPRGLPFINSQYGQTSPSEMFAEAISAYLSADGKHHDMMNPVLKSQVIKVLGNDYQAEGKIQHQASRVAKRETRTPYGLRSQGPQVPTGMGNVHMPAIFSASIDALLGHGDPNEHMLHRDAFGGHRPRTIDWLKDASDEEIAHLVTPISALDHAVMVVQQAHIHDFDQIPKFVISNEIADVLRILHPSGADHAARSAIDYSATDQAQDVIKNALKNPAFAWYVRTFGLPPIVVATPQSEALSHTRPGGSSNAHPLTGTDNFAGAWFQPLSGEMMLGITVNRAHGLVGLPEDESKLGGGIPYQNADGSIGHIVGNVATTEASTLRHEFGHYIYQRLTRWSSHDTLQTLGISKVQAQQIGQALRALYDRDNGQSLGNPSLTQPYWGEYVTSTKQRVRNHNYHPGVFAQLMQAGLPIVNSAYGQYNPQENWAESFTAFTSEHPHIRSYFLQGNSRNTVAELTGIPIIGGKHDKPWERNVSGLASKQSVRESSRVAGIGPLAERAEDSLKLNYRQKEFVKNSTESMHSAFTDGTIYDHPLHSELDGRRRELIDSIRVVRAEGGMPMIVAEPNPILNKYLPVKRDWSAVELPSRDATSRAFEMLRTKDNKPYEYSPDESNGIQKLDTYLNGALQKIKDSGGEVPELRTDNTSGAYTSYVQQYFNSLQDPYRSSLLLEGPDGFHDAFGHFGTGRGYDRHGEWANYLAMHDIIEHAPLGLTDSEKEALHRYWLRNYGLLQIAKRGDISINEALNSRIVDNYNGDIRDVIQILDSGHNGLEGKPSRGLSSIGKSVKDTSLSELTKIGIHDAEVQKSKVEKDARELHDGATPNPKAGAIIGLRSGGPTHTRAKELNISLDKFTHDDDDVSEAGNDWSLAKTSRVEAGDVVVTRDGKNGPEVLMISRGRGPFRNAYALPGGLRDGDETLSQTAEREMEEEVRLKPEDMIHSQNLGEIEARDWDPRFVEGGRIGATMYKVKPGATPAHGDDARALQWVSLKDLADGKHNIAFAHAAWLAEAFKDDKYLGPRFAVLSQASRERNQRLMQVLNEIRRRQGAKEFTDLPDPSVPYKAVSHLLGPSAETKSLATARPWVDMSVKAFINHSPKHINLSVSNPELHRRLYVEILHGEDGGPAGTWTAKKALLLARKYEEQGGTYRGGVRTIQRSMQRWTRETTTGKIRNGNLRRYVSSDSWSRRALSQIQGTGKRTSIGRHGRNTEASRAKNRTIGRSLRLPRG